MPTKKKTPRHVPTPGLYGWITHTDLASADPVATRAMKVMEGVVVAIVRASGGVPIGFSGGR